MTAIDQKLWLDFGREHGPSFESTVHIPRLLCNPAAVEAGLRDALRWATTRTGPADLSVPRIRVYTGHRLDYVAAERLTHSAFDGVSLSTWFNSLCPTEDMCFAFNEVDTWSLELADLLAREVACPLVDAAGEPRSGMEWYSFVGRSGWTPFGLHSDPESSMIFHLGPATKEVWVWDPATLARLPNGRQITFDFEHLLPTARHIVLDPGDFLIIPAFHFHVFRNIGYSAFLGLTIFPQDVRQELANIVMHLAPRPESAYFQPEAARDVIRDAARALVNSESFVHDVDLALDAEERRLRSAAWTKKTAIALVPTAEETVETTEFVVTERPLVPAGPEHRPALFVGGRSVALPAECDPTVVLDVLIRGRRLQGDELLVGLRNAFGATPRASAHALALVRALEFCGGVRPAPGRRGPRIPPSRAAAPSGSPP